MARIPSWLFFHEAGVILRDKVIPHAVLWFMGEAVDSDMDGVEDEYEEEEEDEQEEEEEDEEDDELLDETDQGRGRNVYTVCCIYL